MDQFLSLENLGVFFSIGFVILNAKGNIISWPLGIIGSAIYTYIFYTVNLYGDMTLQIFYVLMGVYGWINWSQTEASDEEFKVQFLNSRKFLLIICFGLVLTPLIGFILASQTNADLPYWDSFTTVFSFIATWMMAKKYIQNWIIWIVVDALCIGIYYYKGLDSTVLLFIIYTLMAIYGLVNWRNISVSYQ